MALAKTQKIQLIGLSSKKEKLFETIQKAGILEIKEVTEDLVSEKELNKTIHKLQKAELDFANLEFAIKLLSPYGKKRSFIQGPIELDEKEIEERAKVFDFQTIIDECLKIEDTEVKAKNEIANANSELDIYNILRNLKINLENLSGSKNANIIVGSIPTEDLEATKKELTKLSDLVDVQVINKEEKVSQIYVIFSPELEKDVRATLSEHKFSEVELPEGTGSLDDYCKKLNTVIKDSEKIIKKAEGELKELSENIENLQIVHDYTLWEKEKLEEMKKAGSTEYSFVIKGWIPIANMKMLEEDLNKVSKELLIEKIEPDEGETPPVIIRNSSFMSPFETVTKIYGLPQSSEMDPTPYLSAFFILFFALCLTDAGYGLVMFVATALALKFLKLPTGTKKLVKLLMYGGVATFIVGALFGGWFSLTTDQIPDFLKFTNDAGETAFIMQKFNSLTEPLTILKMALALGYIQILLGTFMKLFHGIKHLDKKEAILDTGTWAFMLSAIAFTILAASKVIPIELQVVGTWWVILAAAILVTTQGRNQKSIPGKIMFGILSLYGLIGYLSDVLSYSRLLALGLATAIIGLAVNIIAVLMYDLIPYVGWIFMLVVLIGGHLFNLVINTLGSFIHSGRLQFVEFFGQFMEGGGRDFKPLNKKTKYTFINNS